MGKARTINLYLVRHAASSRKKTGIWGRTYDAPLAPDRMTDLDRSRKILSKIPRVTAFSSPMLRCLQSLEYVLEVKHEVCIIPEFRAYHSGKFEDMSIADVELHFPRYANASYSDRFLAPEFGEESIDAQTRRVRIGITKMLDVVSAGNIVVSTHYSVINIMGNIAGGNADIATYGQGRFDVLEGGLVILQTDPTALLK